MRGSSRIAECVVCKKGFRLILHKEKLGTKTCSMACRDVLNRSRTYDDVNQLKRCASCNEWKPFTSFAKSRGSKVATTGIALQSYCTPCSTRISKDWTKKNKEKRKAGRIRSYYSKDSETRAQIRKARMTESARLKKNETQKKYRQANPDKIRMLNKLRFHRQRAAGQMPSKTDLERMFCWQDARCVYCETPLHKYHIDHKTPVSRDGTNDEENIQLLCPSCNMSKSDSTHQEYLSRAKISPTVRDED